METVPVVPPARSPIVTVAGSAATRLTVKVSVASTSVSSVALKRAHNCVKGALPAGNVTDSITFGKSAPAVIK